MKYISILIVAFAMVGCGPGFKSAPGLGYDPTSGWTLRAISTFEVECSSVTNQCYPPQSVSQKIFRKTWDLLSPLPMAYAANPTQFTPSYVIAANTTMTVTGTFSIGAETNLSVPLGSVTVTALTDNNVKVCGAQSNVQCTSAAILIYTTGAVAGLIAPDVYGLPLTAQHGALTPLSVGLAQANAATIQTLTIPGTKHKVNLVDFPTPTYSLFADTTNAETGTYTMTLLVAYALQ